MSIEEHEKSFGEWVDTQRRVQVMSIEEQIAREAAKQCSVEAYALYRKSGIDTAVKFQPIILAAIKRAVAIEREIVKQGDLQK